MDETLNRLKKMSRDFKENFSRTLYLLLDKQGGASASRISGVIVAPAKIRGYI